MLRIYDPTEFGEYTEPGSPVIIDGALVLRSVLAWHDYWGSGVGRFYPPEHNIGDILQWAWLMRTSTPPTGIRLSVQTGVGPENTLAYPAGVTNFLAVPSERSWVLSDVLAVDFVVPYGYIFLDALNKEVTIEQFVIGDPDSIAAHISGVDWIDQINQVISLGATMMAVGISMMMISKVMK